jgi:hypothetical protein
MITKEQREAAVREFNEAVAREKAEKAAKEADRVAALPKAKVLPMPLEEQLRRAIINRRPGVWRVVPAGVTSYVQDNGPSAAEWDMALSRKEPTYSFHGRLEDE